MEENKKFNLKDYALWCERNKKPVEEEKSLSEYKLSLEQENSLKKVKKDENEKILNEAFVNFMKSTMLLLANGGHIEDMKKLSNDLFKECDEFFIMACRVATLECYGKDLANIMANNIKALELKKHLLEDENEEGEEEDD